jgi:Fic family protein
MNFIDSKQKSTGEAIGLNKLIDEFSLSVNRPAVRSEVVRGARKTRITDGTILEQYPPTYEPGGLFGHLRFAMRYEPIDLNVLDALFKTVEQSVFEAWIKTEPLGKYARRAWYLYELLTGQTLDIPDVPPTENVMLLDPKLHVTATGNRVRRQRIIDNLLGNKAYCPMIRRTDKLIAAMEQQLGQEAKSIIEGADPSRLARAVHYLFTKETKSSFAIEGEVPSADRTLRFVAALGRADNFNTSDKHAFVELQNSIVDPRYAQKDWRTSQNYVGQTASNFTQIVHFICPKPEDVNNLMNGWMEMVSRVESGGVDAVCAAAITGFGFVFIHPFEDGNGRIHRFLIHHSLAKLNFAPQGILFPVSAAMLRAPKAYDAALNAFSNSITPRIRYEMDEQQSLTVLNKTDNLYRYYDATPQAEYLYEAVAETIHKDLREEIEFLEVFDKSMTAVKGIVDMPDARASSLIRFVLQNHGTLSKNKRRQFPELRDEELNRLEETIRSMNADATAAAVATVTEEFDNTEFDQFLTQREAKQSGQTDSQNLLIKGVAPAWRRLKDTTKAMTAGKQVDGNPFEWAPYDAYYPDFLQLKDVAASFFDRGSRDGVLQGCSIRFDRRAAASGTTFIDDSPIKPETWSLEPKVVDGQIVWSVKELEKTFTSVELASQVAIRLVKQYELYERAYGR